MEFEHQPIPTEPPPDMDPHAADYEYAFTPTGAGYEHTDADVRLIVKFALWLAVSAIIVHVGVWAGFYMLVEQRDTAQVAEYPLAPGAAVQRLPAGARLQRFPANELYEFRQREQQMLDGYGWVDRTAGTVHIPIAEAMRLTLERGLPSRPSAAPADAAAPPVADTTGASTASPAAAPGAGQRVDGHETVGLMPADSSAGRTMERRRQ